MAGIKQPIQDVLARLSNLDVRGRDGVDKKLYCRIWNNQIRDRGEAREYDYSTPACFVEVVNPQEYKLIGQGYRAADLVFRLHIEHEYYNADGTFEQDLEIYDLRDKIVELMQHFKPTACGQMVVVEEVQNYDHDNVNTFLIDIITHFIDDVGRRRYIYENIQDVQFDIDTPHVTQTQLMTMRPGRVQSTAVTATVDGQSTFYVLDANGNEITGCSIAQVINEIKPLTPNDWVWQENTSNMTLLNGIQLMANQSLFIIYQQPL